VVLVQEVVQEMLPLIPQWFEFQNSSKEGRHSHRSVEGFAIVFSTRCAYEYIIGRYQGSFHQREREGLGQRWTLCDNTPVSGRCIFHCNQPVLLPERRIYR